MTVDAARRPGHGLDSGASMRSACARVQNGAMSVTESRTVDVEAATLRDPKQLMFATLGEQCVMDVRGPVRAAAYVALMAGASVNPATTRAKLDRLVVEGYLVRTRSVRGVEYELTTVGDELLRGIQARMDAAQPFAPRGAGWTLVTFSVPEQQRAARHRLRGALVWEGFAPVRDGLWVAPGDVDLDAALEPMRDELADSSVVVFRAYDRPTYSLTAIAADAWDLDAARRAHQAFAAEWAEDGRRGGPYAKTAVGSLILLSVDWHALLKADPRLPEEYLADDWPADISTAIYCARRDELIEAARTEFQSVVTR